VLHFPDTKLFFHRFRDAKLTAPGHLAAQGIVEHLVEYLPRLPALAIQQAVLWNGLSHLLQQGEEKEVLEFAKRGAVTGAFLRSAGP
jgi:hypothetical protein